MIEDPKLLVEWSSPWREFVSSIRPALSRSPEPLAGEAPTGLFPLRGLLLSWGAEAILLVLAIILPAKMALLRPYHPPPLPRHDVIYFHGNELPRVEDFGGAQAGKSGAAGGKQAHHASQTIRVARGDTARDKVVDAPNLKLPVSTAAVENLLAFRPVPGPPPAEGLKSTQTTPTLSQNAIVAPSPEVLRKLDRRIARLDPSVVAPPPSANADSRRDVMGLTPAIIAPAPSDVQRESGRAIVSMTSPIIQPSPDDVHREPPPLHGPAGPPNTVVPPPVSAPVRESTQQAKLNLPVASVIAPPPSHVTPDRSISGVNLADPRVVPPPVQLGGRSKDPRAVVGVAAAERIVPPPPSVPGGIALEGGGRGQGKKAGGFGTLTPENVVPPPPGMASGVEHSDARGALGGSLGSTPVVPPPPGVSSATSGSGSRSVPGSLGVTAVVPPPPSLSSSNAAGGRGTGNRGTGLGGPMDAGSVLAPPSSAGGSGGGKGLIVSNQPGSTVGVPAGGSPGAIAMSPSGGDKTGLGGAGGGTGIGHGAGPGSGLSGEGTGAAKAGTGRGSDPSSRGGISPYPGPGGAGNGTNGQPPAPGAYVTGGSTATINLPSFGPDDSDPNVPGRSPTGGKRGNFNFNIEASPRAGGGFNRYGMIKADKVYTRYIPTTAGTVVMQFGDPTSVNRVYSQELTSPEPLVYNFPVKLNGARVIIRCQLKGSGVLREFHPLEVDAGAPTARVVAALSTWKFIPAMRGNSPVDVDVLLGFNIDTR
jgi:hypothetical protein